MSGQCVITLSGFTWLRARSSTAPYVPVLTPDTVACQNRWSLTALSQVMPRLTPKYFGDGAALTVRTGTTNRSPSTEASRLLPQNFTMGKAASAPTSPTSHTVVSFSSSVRRVSTDW